MGLGNCLNRGLSRITQMTRIIGGVMVVGGRELSEAGFTGFVGFSGLWNCQKQDLWDL